MTPTPPDTRYAVYCLLMLPTPRAAPSYNLWKSLLIFRRALLSMLTVGINASFVEIKHVTFVTCVEELSANSITPKRPDTRWPICFRSVKVGEDRGVKRRLPKPTFVCVIIDFCSFIFSLEWRFHCQTLGDYLWSERLGWKIWLSNFERWSEWWSLVGSNIAMSHVTPRAFTGKN